MTSARSPPVWPVTPSGCSATDAPAGVPATTQAPFARPVLPFNDTDPIRGTTEAVGDTPPCPAWGAAQRVCLSLPLPEPFHAQILATAARPASAQRLQQYSPLCLARPAAPPLGARQAGWPARHRGARQSARFRDR